MLSKELLIRSLRGKYRNDKVGVFSEAGLVYLAVEAELVPQEMENLFADLAALSAQTLTAAKVFYHASLLHLKFAHIHPFRDGNGRMARLLEKWFVVSKLGEAYWQLPSEKYYRDHQKDYYKNINLGVNFYMLDYNKCLPFLCMLPDSLK